MGYVLYAVGPVFGSRDELIGTRGQILSHVYETPGIPAYLAAKYNSCGDDCGYSVRFADGSKLPVPAPTAEELERVAAGLDDIPF